MKGNELREMSRDDLEGRLAELTEEGLRLRFRSATESIENPMRFRAIRRDIARIKTVLRERAISERAISEPAARESAGQAKE